MLQLLDGFYVKSKSLSVEVILLETCKVYNSLPTIIFFNVQHVVLLSYAVSHIRLMVYTDTAPGSDGWYHLGFIAVARSDTVPRQSVRSALKRISKCSNWRVPFLANWRQNDQLWTEDDSAASKLFWKVVGLWHS